MEQNKKQIAPLTDKVKYQADGSVKVLMDNILTTDQVILHFLQ